MKAALRAGDDETAKRLKLEINARLAKEQRTGSGEVDLTYSLLQGERSAREDVARGGRPLRVPELNIREAEPILDRLSLDELACMLTRDVTVVDGGRISGTMVSDYMHSLGRMLIPEDKALALSPAAREAIHSAIANPPTRDAGLAASTLADLIPLLRFSREREEVPYLLSLLASRDLSDKEAAVRVREAARVLNDWILPRVAFKPEDVAAVKSAWEAHPDVLATAPGVEPGLEVLRLLLNVLPPEENSYIVNIVTAPERYNDSTRAEALARFRSFDPAEQALLIQLMRTDRAPKVRERAADLVGRTPRDGPRQEALALLRLEVLSNPFPEVRKSILSTFRVLVQSTSRREDNSAYLADIQRSAEQDPDPDVRATAERELHELEADRERVRLFREKEARRESGK
ncbi:MAG: hypothetical protein HYY93_15535 [Planctomycetes bacterium]|nr:hypothetical protein [Planctomycetota bacterium]